MSLLHRTANTSPAPPKYLSVRRQNESDNWTPRLMEALSHPGLILSFFMANILAVGWPWSAPSLERHSPAGESRDGPLPLGYPLTCWPDSGRSHQGRPASP